MAGNKDSTCSGCWREHLPCWAVPGTRAETTGDELRAGTQESSWDNDSDSSRDSEEIATHRCVKKGAALPPTIQSFLFSYAGALFFFLVFFSSSHSKEMRHRKVKVQTESPENATRAHICSR